MGTRARAERGCRGSNLLLACLLLRGPAWAQSSDNATVKVQSSNTRVSGAIACPPGKLLTVTFEEREGRELVVQVHCGSHRHRLKRIIGVMLIRRR